MNRGRKEFIASTPLHVSPIRPPATPPPRRNGFGGKANRMDLSRNISPISSNSTMLSSTRMNSTVCTAIDDKLNAHDVSYFPIPANYEDEVSKESQRELLHRSLLTIFKYYELEGEKQRKVQALEAHPNHANKASTSAVATKKGVLPAQNLLNARTKSPLVSRKRVQPQCFEVVNFKPSKTMFDTINMDAFFQTLSVCFKIISAEQFYNTFRVIWPIHEKKQEGLFRREALNWMREIINANPEFFRKLNLNTLPGLFVTPTGHRLYGLLNMFTDYILFLISQRLGLKCFKKPETSDYQSTKRALTRLNDLTKENNSRLAKNNATIEYAKILIVDLKREEEIYSKDLEDKISQSSQMIISYIQKHPNYFPNDAMQIFSRQNELILEYISANYIGVPILKLPQNPLEEVMDRDMFPCIDQTKAKNAKVMHKFFTKYQRLWDLLKVYPNWVPEILNGNDLQNDTSSGDFDLGNFIIESAKRLDEHTSLLSTLKLDESSTALIKSLKETISSITDVQLKNFHKFKPKLRELQNKIRLERSVLEMKMQQDNWLEQFPFPPSEQIKRLKDLDPLPELSLAEKTGVTPKTNSFMQSRFAKVNGEKSNLNTIMRGNRANFNATITSNATINLNSSSFINSQTGMVPRIANYRKLSSIFYKPMFNGNINESKEDKPPVSISSHRNPSRRSSLLNLSFRNSNGLNSSESTQPAKEALKQMVNSLNETTGDEKVPNSDQKSAKYHSNNSSLIDEWKTEVGINDMSLSKVDFQSDSD